jgi:hypothetical protein
LTAFSCTSELLVKTRRYATLPSSCNDASV